jgi:hypothetical protein
MRVASVQVESYRCLQNLTVQLLSYTALVGTNGSGKSAVLYALDWFFNGGSLEEEDICKLDDESDTISVEVTFDGLTDFDKQVLGSYAHGDTAVFRRSWSVAAGEKIIGNAMQGPGFAAVRNSPGADAMKTAYLAIRQQVTGLPAASTMKAIRLALDRWEADAANQSQLVRVADSDANHLFGFNGEATLGSLIKFILVPAASDLANELSQTSRGSALGSLIGALMTGAVKTAKDSWERDNAQVLSDLETAIRTGVAQATDAHAARVSGHLSL